jgi:hypothetical protein
VVAISRFSLRSAHKRAHLLQRRRIRVTQHSLHPIPQYRVRKGVNLPSWRNFWFEVLCTLG